MTLAALLTFARIDNTGGAGPLTLIFPLVLLFVIAALWWVWMRRSHDS
jgi:hypothetical protein